MDSEMVRMLSVRKKTLATKLVQMVFQSAEQSKTHKLIDSTRRTYKMRYAKMRCRRDEPTPGMELPTLLATLSLAEGRAAVSIAAIVPTSFFLFLLDSPIITKRIEVSSGSWGWRGCWDQTRDFPWPFLHLTSQAPDCYISPRLDKGRPN